MTANVSYGAVLTVSAAWTASSHDIFEWYEHHFDDTSDDSDDKPAHTVDEEKQIDVRRQADHISCATGDTSCSN